MCIFCNPDHVGNIIEMERRRLKEMARVAAQDSAAVAAVAAVAAAAAQKLGAVAVVDAIVVQAEREEEARRKKEDDAPRKAVAKMQAEWDRQQRLRSEARQKAAAAKKLKKLKAMHVRIQRQPGMNQAAETNGMLDAIDQAAMPSCEAL
jgi:hypothetical protein